MLRIISTLNTGGNRLCVILIVIWTAAWSLSARAQTAALADEIESDIFAFQDYFLSRFPGMELADFSEGVAGLPQYRHRLKSREMILAIPPYEHLLKAARSEWSLNLPGGESLSDCMSNHPPANEFPYHDGQAIITVTAAVNRCLRDNGRDALDAASAEMAGYVAVFREQANGRAMQLDYFSSGIREAYTTGRQFFWARRGQQNQSCASCHINNAGNRIRDDILSAALGLGIGFPAFSLTQSMSGEQPRLRTLHQQYSACMERSGAQPLSPQSDAYLSLEVYQGIMNTGVPLRAPMILK